MDKIRKTEIHKGVTTRSLLRFEIHSDHGRRKTD